MKNFYLLLFAVCFAMTTNAQTAVNYTFATTQSGSLTDMSSGTTQLIGADQDDASCIATNIGFDFFFQGTRYIQFSVNSNGSIRLGSTSVSNTLYNPLGQAGQALICAYGTDQRTHAGDGKVHFKLTGAAPNRALIIEWLNCQSDFNAGGTADLTYQVRLFETTGVIEFVYGSMSMGAVGAADANSSSPQMGFSSGNAIGTVGSVTAAQSGTPAPTYDGTIATPVNNLYTAGPVSVLTSATNGSRRTFSFTPAMPAAPTSLGFTSISPVGLTLNWTDNATNEVGYVIYQSSDDINYSFVTQLAANSVSFAQTGLYASTTYYWKIVAVSEGGMSNPLSGNQATSATGSITSNGTGGGLWSAPSTWAGGIVPTTNDEVSIKDGDIITIDGASIAYSLTIGEGSSGQLEFEATTVRTLSVYTDVIIAAGAIFRSAATGTQTGHVLSVGRNLTNNGILDFSTNTNTAGASITFTGVNNSSFGGSGTTTDIRQITMNKGVSGANILELNPANFTVRESIIDNVAGGFLVMSNGTLKVSGNFTYTGRVFAAAAYTIPATAGFWLNNPNFTVAAQAGNVINNGILRLTNGTWNFSTLLTHTLTGGAGASFIIEGGTMNVAGRMNPSAAVIYNQSGGVLNLATVGNSGSGTSNGTFTLASTSTFTMSGGTINLVRASTGATPIDWIVSSTSFNYTGGTLNVGTAATVTNFNFRLRGLIPALVIDNTTNNKTATFTAQVATHGNVTINPSTSLVANGQTWLVRGAVLTNNGTITATTTNSRFYFQGTVAQTYTGSGIANTLSFETDNVYGVTIDPLSSGINAQLRINFFNGGVTNANKLTLGLGGTTAYTIQYGVVGGTLLPGNFDVAPVYNIGTGGLSLYYNPEPTAHTTGLEIAPGRTITLLTVNNPNGIIISGGDLAISAGTTPTLTMTTGNITTGSNTLSLGASDILPGTYNYTTGTIIGKFKRWIGASTGNSDFPVGTASAKRNASINFTTAPATGGTLTAEWRSAAPFNNGLPLMEGSLPVTGTSANGYWSVVAGDGLSGGDYTGTFTATGIADVTDVTKLVLVKRANSASPWTLDGIHVTGNGTTGAPIISRTAMVGFSEFGIGSDDFITLPVNFLSFTGRKTGTTNHLEWTTGSEQNNRGFEVQRSTNDLSYSTIGFVNSKAAGGNSTGSLSYSFTDNNPSGDIQYYRLRQVDIDNHSKYSNTISIKREKPTMLAITGLFPNPAASLVNLLVSSPLKDKLTIVVTDINGRTVIQQLANIEAGNNNIAVNTGSLRSGTYTIKLICSGNCESAVGKFVKQ